MTKTKSSYRIKVSNFVGGFFMQRNVSVVEDLNGNKIVFIHDIRFKGRQAIEWEDVEMYLKQYVGEARIIKSTNDMVYIGADLPEEYAHSNYTNTLKGTNAKAKANATQGLTEMIEIATNKAYKENFKEKHKRDAKYGWYRYDSRFALPVFDEEGEIKYYNVFKVIMVVRHAEDGKMYLYDIMNIKKETGTHFQS